MIHSKAGCDLESVLPIVLTFVFAVGPGVTSVAVVAVVFV